MAHDSRRESIDPLPSRRGEREKKKKSKVNDRLVIKERDVRGAG